MDPCRKDRWVGFVLRFGTILDILSWNGEYAPSACSGAYGALAAKLTTAASHTAGQSRPAEGQPQNPPPEVPRVVAGRNPALPLTADTSGRQDQDRSAPRKVARKSRESRAKLPTEVLGTTAKDTVAAKRLKKAPVSVDSATAPIAKHPRKAVKAVKAVKAKIRIGCQINYPTSLFPDEDRSSTEIKTKYYRGTVLNKSKNTDGSESSSKFDVHWFSNEPFPPQVAMQDLPNNALDKFNIESMLANHPVISHFTQEQWTAWITNPLNRDSR